MLEKILKLFIAWCKICAGAFILLIIVAIFIPKNDNSQKDEIPDQSSSKDISVKSEEKQSTVEDTNLLVTDERVEEANLADESKNKIEDVGKSLSDEEQAEEVQKLMEKCTFIFRSPKEKYTEQLKQYDKDIVLKNINSKLKYASGDEGHFDTNYAEKILTTYEMVFPDNEGKYNKMRELIEKYDELSQEVSQEDYNDAKKSLGWAKETIEKSSYLDLRIFRKHTKPLLDIESDKENLYLCEFNGEYVALYSDQDFPKSGYYTVLCYEMPLVKTSIKDDDGFTNEVVTYEDKEDAYERLEEKEAELEEVSAKYNDLTSTKKKLKKLFKKGLKY